MKEASPDAPPQPSGQVPDRRPGRRPVQYKGAPLEAERGPGLGCFWFQVVVLAVAVVITPLSVAWGWPPAVSAGLLGLVILLLFFAGQTVIFLLRLVAAERRAEGRRRPLRSATRTVGELEDDRQRRDGDGGEDPDDGGHGAPDDGGTAGPPSEPGLESGPSGSGPDERGRMQQ